MPTKIAQHTERFEGRRLSRLKVKRAILESGLSQQVLCMALKISPAYLSKLVNGSRVIPRSGVILDRLANLLRVSPADILDGKDR